MTIAEEDAKLEQSPGTSPETPVQDDPKPEAETPKAEATPEPEGGSAVTPPASGHDEDPETGIMARLTGANPKSNASATPDAPAVPAETEVKAKPPAEPVKPGEFVLPTSHELAAYTPRTRERIEQFTAQLKAKDTELGTLKPKAVWADNLIAAAQTAKLAPDRFMGWINLGLDLAQNKANPKVIYDLAIASGYKPEVPAPVSSIDTDKVANLVHSWVTDLDLAPAKAKELMALLATKPAPAAPVATPTPVEPTRPQPVQPSAEQVQAHNASIGMAEVNQEIAEYQARFPATWDAMRPEVQKEITEIEKTMRPEDRDNPRLWRTRYVKAAERVVNRAKPATPQIKTALRPSTTSASAAPVRGSEEYELGLLTGAHSISKG